MADITEQLSRERRMADLGEARARSVIEKNLGRGDASMTPAGMALTRRAVEPLATAIRKFIDEAFARRVGRRHSAATLLINVDPELAAFITIKACLNSASRRYTLTSNALSLAERLEQELIADQFEAEN